MRRPLRRVRRVRRAFPEGRVLVGRARGGRRNSPKRFFVSSRVKHLRKETRKNRRATRTRPRAQKRLARQNDPTRVCVTSHTKKVKILPACAKTRAPPGGTSRPRGRAESSARATHAHGWSLRSSTECSRRGSVESSANAPGGTGGVVATARASRGNKARRAGDISASRAIMFKRLFGADKSGGGSAPSAGSTGGGGGGKTTPLGAVEQLKDVRHPRSHLPRVSFFLEIHRGRVPLRSGSRPFCR